MNLNYVLFRPVRGGLDEALKSVVAFDNQYQLVDYLISTFKIVPHLRYYGFDDRIGWNTYIVLCNKTWLPYGYVHIPFNQLRSFGVTK